MAETDIARHRHPSPLENLTNDARRTQPAHCKTLRRTRSSQALYRQLDSSESIPSLHRSIWDADVASSGEHRAENRPSSLDISPTTTIHPRAELPPPLSPELLDELSDLPVQRRRTGRVNTLPLQPRSNTTHYPTQLEPIVEHRSIASLRSSLSGTRKGRSPVRAITTIQSQRLEHPRRASRWQKSQLSLKPSSPPPSYHRRAFSLDDLDCLRLSSLDCSTKCTRLSASSSSDPGMGGGDDLEGSHLAEPRPPFHPPPDRAPTPPGLPSFGSPDAVNYFNRPPARCSSWWHVDWFAEPRRSSTSASAAARALSANLDVPSPKPTGITRFFSLFAHDSPQWSLSQPRRASLPAGVLRADDGTLVRGRFGGRVSGHGISSRGLVGHPLQRAQAVATESKDTEAADCLAVPRQRESTPRQYRGTVMRGALGPGDGANPTASLSSPGTTYFSREIQHIGVETIHTQQQRRRQQEPSIIDVTAGVGAFLGPNGGAAQPFAHDDTGPARALTDTVGSICTAASASIPESRFWYCWRWFCICCCDMTEDELDGCGWYGADRPWVREGREIVRLERQRGRDREGRVASWDSVGALRTQARSDMEMRFRSGGSRG